MGLHVWDLESDQYNHTQLAFNWDTIDARMGDMQAGGRPRAVEILASLPGSGNFAGRLVMLSAANGGFPAWTMVRYDGSAWRNAGAIEILATVPTAGNYSGRVVVLSAADSGFAAWDIIRYDGSAWDILGGWKKVSTGGGALNISGLQQTGDAYITDANRGVVLVDRLDGTKHRLFISDNAVYTEIVT